MPQSLPNAVHIVKVFLQTELSGVRVGSTVSEDMLCQASSVVRLYAARDCFVAGAQDANARKCFATA
jgi:hypothetical protein